MSLAPLSPRDVPPPPPPRNRTLRAYIHVRAQTCLLLVALIVRENLKRKRKYHHTARLAVGAVVLQVA